MNDSPIASNIELSYSMQANKDTPQQRLETNPMYINFDKITWLKIEIACEKNRKSKEEIIDYLVRAALPRLERQDFRIRFLPMLDQRAAQR